MFDMIRRPDAQAGRSAFAFEGGVENVQPLSRPRTGPLRRSDPMPLVDGDDPSDGTAVKPGQQMNGQGPALTAPAKPQKVCYCSLRCTSQAEMETYLFDYRYDDTDTLMNELQEWFSYAENGRLKGFADTFYDQHGGGMRYCCERPRLALILRLVPVRHFL